MTTPPEMDFLVRRQPAWSASVYTLRVSESACHGYVITSRGAVIKYLATLFSFCQSSSLGLDSFLISSLTANMRSSLSSEK